MNVTTNATAGAQRPLYEMLPLDAIGESPSNPRKTFVELDELAADIKLRGILQPVLVRPSGRSPDAFELVFGARRYRAAKLAGLEAIPAAVRAMSDAEALEVQIVENSKRADIHPLEEADGYRALHETHGYSVEDIAAKVGKSVGFIYGRLKLCALCEDGRAAFTAGGLSPATALLVARIPHAKLQKEAVEAITSKDGTYAMTSAQASEMIQRRFMLRLADAPFDRAAAELVPGVVACTDCPKRTGNQKELFADVQSADLCTDPTCFASKRDAEWKRRTAEAKKTKQPVIDSKKAKELFPYGGQLSHSADFVDLDTKCFEDPKHRTYRQILGKDGPTPTLARDPEGGIHELVPKKFATKALPKAKHDKPTVDPKYEAEKKKLAAEREKENAAKNELIAKVVAAAEKREPTDAFWRFVVARVEEVAGSIDSVLERRGVEVDPNRAVDSDLALLMAKMKAPQLRGLLVELLVHGWNGDALEAAAALYRVDATKGPAKAKPATKAKAKRA